MKNPFSPGHVKVYATTVTPDKLAAFDAAPGGGTVHPLYSTFALAKDAEWACRLFVLDMLEPGEEGIGSFVSVRHVSPALQGSNIRIEATLQRVEGSLIYCTYQAFCDGRLLAHGEQEQRILDKARFYASLAKLQ
jgi:predicted thioesterase